MKNSNYKTIRKIAFTLLMLFTLSLDAQENGVFKFMGIPIDGPKSEMISKLEEKGFAPEDVFIDVERAENDVLNAGGEINGGTIRENDELYGMKGQFDGRDCTLMILSYHRKVYKIVVAIKDSYKKKLEAFFLFNDYAEKLQKKYYSENNLYKPLDYSGELELDADYFNMFFDSQRMGGVVLHITYPSANMEYHIVLEYVNADNMPNGEDL